MDNVLKIGHKTRTYPGGLKGISLEQNFPQGKVVSQWFCRTNPPYFTLTSKK